jgi:hemoglobin-like flavoprotein
VPAIRGFAVRYVEYGVGLADYVALREALLWTLEQALGEDLTPAVLEGSTDYYEELAGEMRRRPASDYDLPLGAE